MAIVAAPYRHAYAWSQKGRLSSWPRGVDDESRAARPPGADQNMHASKTSTHTAKFQDLQGVLVQCHVSLQLQRSTSRFHAFAFDPSACCAVGAGIYYYSWEGVASNSLIPMDGWMDRHSAELLVRSVFPPLLQPDRVDQCRDRCPCMHGRHLF